MAVKQKTLKNSIKFSGKGLHTGRQATLELLPASENHGVIFQRVDIEGAPCIEAIADYVTSTDRGTTIRNGEVSVSTVEHILSVLYAYGIDNVLIKIDGPEVPILDGSAAQFASEISNVGIVDQVAEKKYFVPKEKIYYKDEQTGAEITILPDDGFYIDLNVDFNSSVIGRQSASFKPDSDYLKEFAYARTFVFLHDVMPLLKSNLIKGGDLKNALVIVEKLISQEDAVTLSREFNVPDWRCSKTGYLSDLRYDNECARHKLLDVIGDFSLVGLPMKARIIANKSGHKINTIVAKIIRKEAMEESKLNEIPTFDPNKEPLVDINGIKKLLPHRPPFLMVDRITEMTHDYVVGIKNIGVNEGYFIGHFPDEPVMPGVLIVEAMGQVGGILVLSGLDEPEKYSTYFAKFDNVRFKRKVVPGDTLVIKVYFTAPIRRSIVCMRGEAYVGNTLACQGDMVAQVIKNK